MFSACCRETHTYTEENACPRERREKPATAKPYAGTQRGLRLRLHNQTAAVRKTAPRRNPSTYWKYFPEARTVPVKRKKKKAARRPPFVPIREITE
jgi:hypothetical protein